MLNKLTQNIKKRIAIMVVSKVINHELKTTKGMKNWRTFVVGLAGALFTASLPLIKTGTFNIHTDWPSLLEACGIAFFGYVAKDAMVTGTPTDSTNKPA